MKKTMNELFNAIRTTDVRYERHKYNKLIENPLTQAQLHEKFSLVPRGKSLLKVSILSLAVLASVGLGSYFLWEHLTLDKTATEQSSSSNTSVQQAANKPAADAGYETMIYLSPPKNYPRHLARTAQWTTAMKSSSLMVAEVSPDEYEALGLQLDAQGTLLYAYKNVHGNTICRFVSDSVSYGFHPSDVQRFQGKPIPSFYPHLITDTLGVCRFVQYRSAAVDSDLSNRIMAAPHQSKLKGELMWEMDRKANAKYGNPNAMIALLIHTERRPSAKDRAHWLPDVLLWYEATPEFMKALPATVVMRPLNQSIPTEESPRYEKSNVFFDMRSPDERAEDSTHSVFNITAFPNPVQGQRLSLRYELHTRQVLSFALHDINGRDITTLLTSVRRSAGTQVEEFQLPHLQTGIYLLSITTAEGERRSERIFVEP